MSELVPDRRDGPARAYRLPVDGDEPKRRLEERNGVLGDEGRGRARVSKDPHEPVGVALDAAEYVDDRMRAEAPLEFALDSGNVRRNRRSHDLLVPARKDRLDAQAGGSRHERETKAPVRAHQEE